MCGIVGYVGSKYAVPILLEGLHRLEYRGYDSAGIAVIEDGELFRVRMQGKVNSLVARLAERPFESLIGMGHTRWATHGKPSGLLLDSRGVNLRMSYTPIFVTISSLKPLFFNGLKNELRFLDHMEP